MHEIPETVVFINGKILFIDKELNWTSFDVVNKVRVILKNRLGIKKIKVGHAGTLDPLATGLVIVCTGKATKSITEFQDLEKEYVATIKLGDTTPSFDLETEVDSSYATDHITREKVEMALQCFLGEIDQIPPLFSAKYVNGTRAYELARKGEEVELKPNRVKIVYIELISFELPIVKLRIICSKGTYIRSLARDIGLELKSGAHLTELRRTRIGDFTVGQAQTIKDFEKNLTGFETI
jgi:tRNA pseudouridine55 synthase